MLGGLSRTSMAFALGEAMLREGKFDEAVEAFRRVVAEDPRDGAGRLGLCLARAGAGQYGPAAEALREGLRQTSDWGFLKLDLSKALGSAEAAERLMGALQDAAGKEAGGGDAHLLLAFLHFATSEYRIAAQELWAAYDAGTLDAVAWELLLRCEHMLPADKGEQKGGPEG
jgi:tetratricopeptide (TPR) repeat protein